MAIHAIVRPVVTLVKNNVTLGIYTNNFAAYNKMLSLVPPTLQSQVISISTVNRKLKGIGTFINISTPVGEFILSKEPLYRFFEQTEQKEIGEGQNAMQGCNVDSTPM